MENIKNKIAYGTIPDEITLIFPKHSKEQIKNAYIDFYTTKYDKFKPFAKIKKLSSFEKEEHNSKIHSELPYIVNYFISDDYKIINEGSTLYLNRTPSEDKNVAQDLYNQFSKYLWNNKIPVAQHLSTIIEEQN